jgi:hypothetical protein
MGILRYHNEDFELDDRILAHLQVVISTKLRRGENFFFTWHVPASAGSGRHAIWVDNGVPLHITFSGSKVPSLNREWIEAMIVTTATSGGLQLTEEPAPEKKT